MGCASGVRPRERESGPRAGEKERRSAAWAVGLARVRRGAGPAWGSAGPGRLGLARDLGWVSREGWAGPGLSLGPVGFWFLLSFSTSNSN